MSHLPRNLSTATAAAPVPAPAQGLYLRCGKRCLDLGILFLVLPAALPVILILWLVARADGGPGFFGHLRLGQNGRTFRCWKIRTMVPDAEDRLARLLALDPVAAHDWATDFKLRRDPRITPAGRILRRLSLDELPQLYNVLRGEMSLVGPRPVIAAELARYHGGALDYCAMKPGLTGLWQISDRDRLSYRDRVALDRLYRRQVTLALDLAVLSRTVRVIWRRDGR